MPRSNAVRNGKAYELRIAKLIKKQRPYLLAPEPPGGCSSRPDISLFTPRRTHKVGAELKHGIGNPCWGQGTLLQSPTSNQWRLSRRSRLPPESQQILNHAISQISISHNGESGNEYHTVSDPDLIPRFYASKGNSYIQCSDGLFKTTDADPCGFGVPRFAPSHTKIRIRVKSHGRGRKKSVTMVLAPGKIQKSPKSFENISSLPTAIVNRNP